MKNRFIISNSHLLTILILFNSLAFSQVFEWAKQTTGTGSGESVAVDANGNSFVTGSFGGTTTFGNVQLTPIGGSDIFVLKYDENGNVLWVKQGGGFYGDVGLGISIDDFGNCYVTGYFVGDATFESIQLTSYGDRDVFIAKYDPNGDLIWVKNAGSSAGDRGVDIETDANGNCIVTGAFIMTATFDTTQITSYGVLDMFLAKYDSNGNVIWVRNAGGINGEEGQGLAIDANSNIYVTGNFSSYIASFGNIDLVNSGSADIFVAKYDGNGNVLWANAAGGSGNDYGFGVSSDQASNCVITGSFNGTATFGSLQLNSFGNDDIFIAKYNSVGNLLWVNKYGGSGVDRGYSISSDTDGNIYSTGYFEGTATFGNTQLVSAGSIDIFIQKVNQDGNSIWTNQGSGPLQNYAYDIVVDNNGNQFLSGSFTGGLNFAGFYLISPMPSTNMFITKMNQGSLIVSSPNGGEQWQALTVHNITWNSTLYGNIKIEISTDNGSSWFTLVNSMSAAIGNYTYTVTPFSSTQCLIKISSLNYLDQMDISNNPFTITSATVENLTITSPNYQLVWGEGFTHDITWQTTGDISNAKLEYSIDNGLSWITIINSVPAINQSFLWEIPNTPSNLCRVRISDVLNAALNDVSDQLFTIAQLDVVSPNGSELLKAGSIKKITWTSSHIANIDLFYSDPPGHWNFITTIYDASVGEYNWTIPNISVSNCEIRAHSSTTELWDVSDNTFTIWQPIISQQTPGLGQTNVDFGATLVDLSAFVIVAAPITVTYNIYELPTSGNLPVGVYATSDYYWNISAGSISFINGKISIPVADIRGFTEPSELVWLKRTNSGDPWENIGGQISGNNLESTTFFNSFSEFAIGSTGSPITNTRTPGQNQVEVNFGATNINLVAIVNESDQIMVTYFVNNNPVSGTLPSGVLVISQYYWQILSPSINFAEGKIFVPTSTLRGVSDPTKLVWLKRTNSGDPWENIGGQISGNNLESTTFFNSFSEFAIGSTDLVNPLPVELISFTGKLFENVIKLDWETKTEVDNYGFEIERNVNEQNWIKLGFVQGCGNSNSPKSYTFTDMEPVGGNKFQYRLKQIDTDGSFTYSHIVELLYTPEKFELFQNYPNPFNPKTTIRYNLETDSKVKITVYNINGEEVSMLIDEFQKVGRYMFQYNPSNLASGIYLLRIQTDQHIKTIKMILLK